MNGTCSRPLFVYTEFKNFHHELIMSKFGAVHWSTPAIIVSSLLAGFFFALGHHLFNQCLGNTEVHSGTYSVVGYSISKQQSNIAIGNVFAYPVKACLSIAMSAAYLQVIWRMIRRSRDGEQLQTVDTAFCVLDDLTEFFNIKVWIRNPLALVVAVLYW